MKKMIQWMAGNHVAANLLMMTFIVGGLILGTNIKQEIFPEVEMDRIIISTSYPGASPEDIEEGILLKIEESISSVDGIKEVISTAYEGRGIVVAEIMQGKNSDIVLQDIKNAVDGITSFPENAEKPVISKMLNLKEVISVIVYGDMSEKALREKAEEIRNDLLSKPDITQVELGGVRNYEISINVSENKLRKYKLTLGKIASIIRQSSLDIPGGKIKTKGGEILLREKAKKYSAGEYAKIKVIANPDGTFVKLGDIATIKDGFEEKDIVSKFNGKRAAMVKVYRVSDQKPIEISNTVKQYIKEKSKSLPPSVKLATWNDTSEILQSRINLLLKNAKWGLFLVFITLSLFLEIRLAFWVMLGVPISFLGALFVIPAFDISINMISLFAFILALGILVDDAIVIGENIFDYRQQGMDICKASVKGANEVAGPVIFSALTTIAAFLPLAYITGVMGKFMRAVPVVVISLLCVSLVESLLILPAHLASTKRKTNKKGIAGAIEKLRLIFVKKFDDFTNGFYKKSINMCIKNRYITMSVGLLLLFITIGIIGGGIIKFNFMPDVEGDKITVSIKMPPGTVLQKTEKISDMITKKAMETIREIDKRHPGEKSVFRDIYAITGGKLGTGGPVGREGGITDSNQAEIALYLTKSEYRNIPTSEIKNMWRKKVGEVTGADSVIFASNLVHMGANIEFRLAHKNFNVLKKVSERLKKALSVYPGISDIEDNFSQGKKELRFKLKPRARAAGLTENDLAKQIRNRFYGAEALRLQLGRNEVKVMVKYPESLRKNLGDLENIRILTPLGGEIPINEAAWITEKRGFSEIKRINRKRVIKVSASVDKKKANSNEIIASLKKGVLKELIAENPGLSYSMSGEKKEQTDSLKSMRSGFMLALFAIFALLAIPFKSYLQPFIIMTAIPFGIVGAVIGHIIMGYNLSIMSIFGIIALSGVVVNDSLILIDKINVNKLNNMPLYDAIINAGIRRMRPIMLTSLTTFFGLIPMILEKSTQAQFLVPMAISLGCGVMFATFITLLLIPAMYMILEDFKKIAVYFSGSLNYKKTTLNLESQQEQVLFHQKLN